MNKFDISNMLDYLKGSLDKTDDPNIKLHLKIAILNLGVVLDKLGKED